MESDSPSCHDTEVMIVKRQEIMDLTASASRQELKGETR